MLIGCDITHIPRMQKNVEKKAFLERVFHPAEIKYCQTKDKPESSFAARFAAKEAFSKALGSGLYVNGLSPQMIWIEHDDLKCPKLCWDPKVTEILAAKNLKNASVSLAHDGEYAMATVLLW